MKKKTLAILLLLTCTSSAFAGFNGLTHHSRANCANNETVSWDKQESHWLSVTSDHFDHRVHPTAVHTVKAPMEFTWRSAAVHWGEGAMTGKIWEVRGLHYTKDKNGQSKFLVEEWTNDCSYYDGWWD